MAQVTKQANKVIQIIARVTLKSNPDVVLYRVRSSNGQDEYCTRIYQGKAQCCSCPATKPCYHMVQLEERERSRSIPALASYDVVGAALAVVNAELVAEQVGNAYELIAAMREAVASVPSYVEREQDDDAETRRCYYEMSKEENW